MRILGIGIILSTLLAWASPLVWAATDAPAVELDAVVVTAAGEASDFRTGDVALEETPVFFTVIERETFEGKMTDLAQVIEKEAGIQVRQSGGIGTFSSVSLRGSTSEQVMIYLDGVLLNDASGGGVDLSNISLSDVAAIEIYRGSAPIQFGKASIGGVVNIRTLRSKGGVNGNVSVGYGSFDTFKGSAFLNHKPGSWDYLFSAEFLDTENDFEYKNTKGTLWNPDDDRWEDRQNAQIQQINLLGKVGWDVGDTVRASLVNQWFEKDQGIAAWNNSPDNETYLDTRRDITTLKFTLDDLTALHLNTATRLDLSWMEEEYKDLKGQVGLGQSHTRNTTLRYGVNTYAEWLTDNNTLALIADLRHETYEPEDLTGQHIGHDSDRTLFILGLEDSLFLFDGRLSLTPGLRFTHIDNKLKGETSDFGVELEAVDSDESYWSPQIGIRYRAFDWLTLKTNLARYVREPSFFELFGDRGFFISNLDLKAEEGVNWDVGAEAEWMFSEAILERIAVNVAYFRSDVDDLITRVYDARGIGRSENISSSVVSGVEASVSIRFLNYFTLSGNMTLQDTENGSDIEAFDGKELPGRYGASYLARLEARRWGFKATAEYLADKEMYYDTANLLEAEDKEEINLGLSYLFKDRLRIGVEARNIQNNYSEDFYRYPLPGRSYFVSLKYMF